MKLLESGAVGGAQILVLGRKEVQAKRENAKTTEQKLNTSIWQSEAEETHFWKIFFSWENSSNKSVIFYFYYFLFKHALSELTAIQFPWFFFFF